MFFGATGCSGACGGMVWYGMVWYGMGAYGVKAFGVWGAGIVCGVGVSVVPCGGVGCSYCVWDGGDSVVSSGE